MRSRTRQDGEQTAYRQTAAIIKEKAQPERRTVPAAMGKRKGVCGRIYFPNTFLMNSTTLRKKAAMLFMMRRNGDSLCV